MVNIPTARETIEQAGIAVLGISAIYRVVVIEVTGIVADWYAQRIKLHAARLRALRHKGNAR
jgi:hypothetical protein